jgi:hypothetical protein
VNLQAIPSGNTIAVTWDEVEGAAGYDIQIDDGSPISVTDAVYMHAGLTPGISHTYKVRSKYTGGLSDWSAAVTAKISSTSYPINCSAGEEFNLVLTAVNIPDPDERTFKLKYDPSQLEVVDLSSLTPDIELDVGAIEGTNITITGVTTGEIDFTIAASVPYGQAFTGIVNTIKFKAKITGQAALTYDIN